MDVHNPFGVERQDFRRRRTVGNLTHLNHREAGVRTRSQVGERERDGTGAVDFELEAHRAGPLGRPPYHTEARASDGIPRPRPMLPPFQQYTVQGMALSPEAPCFCVYAPPLAPIPPEGIELDPLVSFGVASRRRMEAKTLWESLHGLAGGGHTDRSGPPTTAALARRPLSPSLVPGPGGGKLAR